MPDPNYTLRLAAVDDLSALRAVELDAARRFSGTGLLNEAQAESAMSPEHLTELINNQQVWVVCHGSNVVGFAAACVLDDGVALLDEIDVVEGHGRKGLGKQLIDAVIDWARGRGFSEVILSTFAEVPWNAPYYERCGFKTVPSEGFSADMVRLRKVEESIGLPVGVRVFMTFAI